MKYLVALFTIYSTVRSLPIPDAAEEWYQHENHTETVNETHLEAESDIRIVNGIKLWPYGIVPYKFHKSVGVYLKALLWQAFDEIHENTCVRFVPKGRTNQTNYVTFVNMRNCGSRTGLMGYGEQFLYLGNGCHHPGFIFHELFHLLGFSHEHARPDRDNYVTVNKENVMKGHEQQFDKLLSNETIILNDFDYDSIMMYGGQTYSKDRTNALATIVAKDTSILLLDPLFKEKPSKSDYWRVNKLYNCNDNM